LARLSHPFVDEMVRGLLKLPRVKLASAAIHDLAYSPLYQAAIIEPDSEMEPALRDPADQQLLGTLRASGADYLITGDKDLLALAEKYPIVTPVAFWERHGW
jgi:putative PIN family toxin of toxin-antitoxin system